MTSISTNRESDHGDVRQHTVSAELLGRNCSASELAYPLVFPVHATVSTIGIDDPDGGVVLDMGCGHERQSWVTGR